MVTQQLPANLIMLRPQEQASAPTVRAPRVLPPVSSRGQLFERLETIGALGPGAPLSFVVVRLEGFGDSAQRTARDAAMRTAAARTRELVRSTDCVGRLGNEALGVVLQGTGATAAAAVAARLTYHLDRALAGDGSEARAVVSAATGLGVNAGMLPVAAMDSLGDCG